MAERVPAVSVVIPTYNRVATLPRALESVLRQTFQDIEVIVVDDCSTDGSWDYLQSVRDPRLRIVRHEANRGGGAARNSGIALARAGLVAFQDSDDEWLVTKLARQMELYRREGDADHGAVYCAKITNGEGRFGIYGPREVQYMPLPHYAKTAGDIRDELLDHAMVSTQTLLVRRALLERVGGFDESFRLGQDWDLTTRLAQETRFLFLDVPLVLCFTSPDSISKMKTNQAQVRRRMLEKHHALIARRPRLHATYLTEIGRVYQRAGCWRQSLPWLVRALRAWPGDRRAWAALMLGSAGALLSGRRMALMPEDRA